MNEIEASSICKALADANRLKIVRLLSTGEKCGCVLLEELSITQPTLSHHMKVLMECELVTTRKEGKWSHYSLNCLVLTDFRHFIQQLHCEDCQDEEGRCKPV